MKNFKPKPLSQEIIDLSKLGNPGNPNGKEGDAMLDRMNVSHYEFTGWALEHIQIPQTGNILDIGCGGGITLKRISSETQNAKIFGIDYSEVAIRKSKLINKEEIESGKTKIEKASLENLPFSSNYFDLITSFETFYFWPDHVQNLIEIKRTLKKNAIFLLASECYDHENLNSEIRKKLAEKQIYNPDYNKYKNVFELAGFVDFKILTHESGWICVVAKNN